MQKISEFLSGLTASDLERVEELASQNFAPSQISEMLLLDKWAFMRVWRDQESVLRKRYELGRTAIAEEKQVNLLEKVRAGNTFAIQLHDKAAKAQRFEDIKNEIFNLE
ncbi:hypothetical protein [Allomuricauda sp. ARW1Y1]|jgi:hypothetical protein|uniref:hypothetical protein n=1 Tax=Allomuricauda sp. ARW1Y1 TaxID=2663843 RepID=UPI0015CC7B18|nr:hypothetical protein [Muricauda sp. ARW1Y1]NYJ27515.1 hypothetical protein [Muricauda sp. ARW1Y1]